MIQTETSKVWRFLSGLCPGLAGLVDTRRDGLESYTNAVRRAIRQESWMKTDKSLSLGTSSGQKEVLQPSPLQIMGNQRGGRRFWFHTRWPNNQDRSGGFGGKPQAGGKRKSGPRNQG